MSSRVVQALLDADRDLEPVLQFHNRPPECPAGAIGPPAALTIVCRAPVDRAAATCVTDGHLQ